MNSRKPTATSPMTPMTRAIITSGMLRLKSVTAPVQTDNVSAHSSSEPSCPPHTAENRYCVGNWVFEFCAT